MNEYHKIQSIFKRDEKTKKFTSEYSLPEFEYLAFNEWEFTEKVDGTNVRVMLTDKLSFGGKTDNAQMPITLLNELQRMFSYDKLRECFPGAIQVCLYGEGYGAGIQKGGVYGPVSFVLFDIWVEGNWWLKRDDVDEIGKRLGIKTVPVVGYGTLHDAILHTQMKPYSTWGKFVAEGVVCRPTLGMLDRAGRRIITKLKVKDFE